MCVVSCATNFYQGCVHSPYSFCSLIPAKHGRRRIARARRGVCKAGFACDDAPRAAPSDARHDGWYGPDGRKIWQHTQQSTASPCRALDWQIDSSLLIQWIVMHGRSSLMESFVWLLPFLCVLRKREREPRERERNKKQEREREKSRLIAGFLTDIFSFCTILTKG